VRHPIPNKPFQHPLKHRVYPKRMTIAAGFLYRDGVLLCADTEVSGWAHTLHASKVVCFDCLGGKIGMAYAGNKNFAVSAIQKCMTKLASTKPDETFREIERILDKEYRRNVLSHPSQSVDSSLAYQMLVSLCSPSGVSLYCSTQTALVMVTDYDCIGIGEALAHYLVRPTFTSGMFERQALSLATFVLACVKGSVPGCGGMSQFVAIRKDGTVGQFYAGAGPGIHLPTNTDWLERHSKFFDARARRILFDIPNPDITDGDFEGNLDYFKREMLELRKNWRDASYVHESFRDLVQGKPRTLNLEDAINPQLTRADQTHRQPSRESPEESDVSGTDCNERSEGQ
jgi:hypothetical protein